MLTQHELEGFEGALASSLKATEITLQHLDEGLDFGDDIDHLDEEADETEEFANRLGAKKTLQEKTENIKEALVRIKNGSYGVCANCKKDIEMEILHALPESHLCRSCKQKERSR